MQNKENFIQKSCDFFNHNIILENCTSNVIQQSLKPFFSSRLQVIKNYVYYDDPIVLKEKDYFRY